MTIKLSSNLTSFFLFIAAIAPVTTCANDGIGQLGIGGVISYGKSDSVSMRKEVLEISASKISVDYEFFNESDKDIKLPVVFPLPPYMGILPSQNWAGQPVGFKLLMDGLERPFVTHVRATIAWPKATDEDVTGKLVATGLTKEQIALFPGVLLNDEISPFRGEFQKRISSITSKQQQVLRQLGLLVRGPSGERDYPAWKVHIAYAWNMMFPARSTIHVSHSYKPFRSGGSAAVGTGSSFDELKNLYCASDRLINKLKSDEEKLSEMGYGPRPNESYGLAGTKVDYILTTANTWKGPIRDFTLRIKKIKPGELVSLCFPGTFRKVDATTLEAHLKDFVPSSELNIRFFNPLLGNAEEAASVYSGGPHFEAPKFLVTPE